MMPLQRNSRNINRMKKKSPYFKNEDQEREFWANHSTSDYIDWSNAKRVVFPNLKPSVKSISLRFPQSMLEELKVLANKRDVPYQSLMKIFLSDCIQKEFKFKAA